MSRILVTGANGFVGRSLCRVLRGEGHAVTGLVRRAGTCVDGIAECVHTGSDFSGLDEALGDAQGYDCVIHLAARVHVLREYAADAEAAFHAANVDGSVRVAQAARRIGAKRLVFASSIKAVADTDDGRPLRENDPAQPADAYGRSKYEAEQALRRYGAETGLEVVIVRPPLVYGPEVRANFLRLMDAVWKGMPLPLAGVRARRSLVYVENLASALALCATDPRAAGQCFHIADDVAPEMASLVRMLGEYLRRPARLVPLPVSWLRTAGRLAGRSAQIERLVGSLRVDSSHIREVLGWRAPHTLENGLAITADWYRSTH